MHRSWVGACEAITGIRRSSAIRKTPAAGADGITQIFVIGHTAWLGAGSSPMPDIRSIVEHVGVHHGVSISGVVCVASLGGQVAMAIKRATTAGVGEVIFRIYNWEHKKHAVFTLGAG